MKNIIYLLIVLILGQDSLLRKATNDFSKQSPFLFIHLKQLNHKSSYFYCIKNDDLFRFLYNDSDISTKKYSLLVFESISKMKVITYKKNKYQELQRYKFEENDRIVNTLNKKSVEQIKYLYFRENILKKGLNDLIKRQIIYSLFLKGILIGIDDESGEYMIY